MVGRHVSGHATFHRNWSAGGDERDLLSLFSSLAYASGCYGPSHKKCRVGISKYAFTQGVFPFPDATFFSERAIKPRISRQSGAVQLVGQRDFGRNTGEIVSAKRKRGNGLTQFPRLRFALTTGRQSGAVQLGSSALALRGSLLGQLANAFGLDA